MSQNIIRISKKDRLVAELPKNNERTWLKIRFGSGSDQMWINLDAAHRLHAELARILAEIEVPMEANDQD